MNIEQHPFEKLIGNRIVELKIADSSIVFQLENYSLIAYSVSGDCCSQSWFSDILNFNSVRNKVIHHLEEPEGLKDYNIADGRCRDCYDEVYGVTLVAEDGSKCDIYFRNSSNGYYGGYLNEGEGADYNNPLYYVALQLPRVVDEWHNV